MPRFIRKRTYRKKNTKVSKPVRKYVKSEIHKNIEDKFRLTQNGTFTAPLNITSDQPLCAFINGMTQGTGEEQRVGTKIRITSLELRATVTGVSTNAVAGQSRVRLVIVWDKNNNGGATPAGSALYTQLFNNTITAVTGGLVNTFDPNWVSKRYRVLYDRVIDIPVSAAYHNGVQDVVYPDVKHMIVRKRFKRPLVTQFSNGNAGNQTDVISGAMLVFWISDIATGVGNPTPNVVYTTKIQYEDA